MEDCAYLGEKTGEDEEGNHVHQCRLLQECKLTGDNSPKAPVCEKCNERLQLDQPDFAEKWVDPLIVVDRRKNKTEVLQNLLAHGKAFLICGGPSANDLPLEQLSRKGVFSLAVNNVAAHPRFRPQAFVCSDPPQKFSHSIWLDPGIMKFIPTPKLRSRRGKLRKKLPNGEFEMMKTSVIDCPNVWGFQRWSWLWPNEQFFLTEGACWGNHRAGVEKTGQPKTVCTMLLALRILYYLGARRIFLVGVDFRMSPDCGYSFGQERTEGASKSNNSQFAVVNDWLCTMQKNGIFRKFGLEIFNTYNRSGLRAFDYVPFEDAILDCKGDVEMSPNLGGWYDK